MLRLERMRLSLLEWIPTLVGRGVRCLPFANRVSGFGCRGFRVSGFGLRVKGQGRRGYRKIMVTGELRLCVSVWACVGVCVCVCVCVCGRGCGRVGVWVCVCGWAGTDAGSSW